MNMNNFYKWFADKWELLIAVKASDEEEERLGRLFNILMVISLGIVLTLSILLLLMQPLGLASTTISWVAAAFPLFFLPLSIFCLIQARRGRIRPMILLYVWVNLIAIGVAAWVFDGIYSPVWVIFFWNVSIGGILLKPVFALKVSGGVLVYYLLLLLMTRLGVYTPPLTFGIGRDFVNISITMIVLISTIGLLTYLNMRSLHEALEKLRQEIAGRKQTEESLRESEERFRSIFEHVDDIIYTADADGTFSSISPSSERMLGWQPGEWIGRPFSLIVHPDDLSHVQELYQQGIAGKPLPVFQARLLTKTGGYLEAEVVATPIRRSDSIIMLAVVRDITERKRTEEEIRKLNEELEDKVKERTKQLLDAQDELIKKEKLATLGQIAGSVGHELRNPLGVMSNAIYFLKTVHADADDITKEYLEIIEDEIGNSERIVSDLLDSVRTKPPQPQFIRPAELIQISLSKCKIPDNIKMDIKSETKLPLKVDPLQVEQVFINLIKNAFDAMPDGGELEILAEENKENKTISFVFKDSGTGIAPENIPKLFNPLYTTKARGIGLGLVVVKNLTHANGGKVEVTSELGKGTTFTLAFPMADERGI